MSDQDLIEAMNRLSDELEGLTHAIKSSIGDLILNFKSKEESKVIDNGKISDKVNDIKNMGIEELDFNEFSPYAIGKRVIHNFRARNIETVNDLIKLSIKDFKKTPSMGKKSIDAVVKCLKSYGLELKD